MEKFDLEWARQMGYAVSFASLPGNSGRVKSVMESRPSCFDYYDFPEYTVAVTNGGAGEQFRGDRIIAAKDGSFHMVFRKFDGYTAKWGRTMDEDPTHCPWGNEIADIEITTACSGIRDKDGNRAPCIFCYKSNQPNGSYMSFDTFKVVFDKMNQPRTMTQIAFGVDAECKTNPDVWKIMDYAIENGVTPNVTVADIDQETAENIVKRCGACAVSCYERNKNRCYDSIKLLTNEVKRQGREHFSVNMHLLVSHETEDFVFEVLNDRLNDERLKDMGAIVLLSLKQKGRGKAFRKMDDEVYKKVIFFLQDNKISYGSDSCGANRLMNCLKAYYDGKENGDKQYKKVLNCVEPCESTLYSQYINVDGKFFPCSFMEGEEGWKDGIDLTDDKYKNFTTQVWNHPRILEWRQNAIRCINCNGCNQCPHYEI